jgi:hypothetical protein
VKNRWVSLSLLEEEWAFFWEVGVSGSEGIRIGAELGQNWEWERRRNSMRPKSSTMYYVCTTRLRDGRTGHRDSNSGNLEICIMLMLREGSFLVKNPSWGLGLIRITNYESEEGSHSKWIYGHTYQYIYYICIFACIRSTLTSKRVFVD